MSARTVLVAPGAALAAVARGGFGLYVWVSSYHQQKDLDRQVARLTGWATQAGRMVVRVETEVGSGINGARSTVRRHLADPAMTTIVVEHRARLRRKNTELIEAALAAHGRRLVADYPVRDMTEILTSFCAGLYGRRSARNRAEKALRCAARDQCAEAGR